ncbi:MAG: DUF3604 domain-containing protein [Myxococcota bacterium]
MTERHRGRVALVALLLSASVSAAAFDHTEARADCVNHVALRQPFFGDLHVHTTYSLDASTQGTRTTPAEAYRFARGEEIGLHPFAADGTPLRKARIDRPLDFVAVTDHAELFGEARICRNPALAGYGSLMCRIYRHWPRLAFFLMNSRATPRFAYCGPEGAGCLAAARDVWQIIQDAAENTYDRTDACAFTSFVGLEWTKTGPGARNLHRNVIFRNRVVPARPLNALDQPSKEALWDALDRECKREDGCQAIVIPHNSNLSGDLMFQTVRATGEPIDAAYARRRAAREPLVEIMQHKGASECRRSTAPADELCGFEELPYDRFMGRYLALVRSPAKPMNFTRHALAQGLVEQQKLGANPFKFGLIGSTDTHLGSPGLVAESADFPGHGGAGTPVGDAPPTGLPDAIEFNPGGLAVLWAEENSRDSLFEAMLRREAYGTSGPRIVLRLFGGWGYPADLCQHTSFVEEGYTGGVPMGADLPPSPREDAAPVLAVAALQDPGTRDAPGTPLQRIQIIKAWVADGAPQERVIDVAGSPDNGASVDPTTCETQGHDFAGLCAVWRDPDFDPTSPALYYARVVENPTCRWSTRVCNAHHVDCTHASALPADLAPCCDPAIPRTIQERAWSSPIWYGAGGS